MANLLSLSGGKTIVATIPDYKSGVVAGASFTVVSGKRVYSVVFTTAFSDTNYSITITGSADRSWTYESKLSTGFTINANAASDFTGDEVSWQAIKIGES